MTFNYMLGTLICARHATMRSTYKYVLDTGACAQPANLLDTRIVCARRTKRPTHKNAFDKQICARHTNMPSASTKVCSALKRVLDKATDGPASVHLCILPSDCNAYMSAYTCYIIMLGSGSPRGSNTYMCFGYTGRHMCFGHTRCC